ncbi:MAG TPA: sensor domain-containing diguanylate cyclase [Patescibacteria group bacterium]|nr:sensor domain-containing diguanylate cyclase [Patescibacteria group bacterium]
MNKDRRKRPAIIEQSYRSLIESIKDYAIFMLDKKGKITSWDQGGVKLFGYKRNDIIGKKFSILFTKENLKKGKPDSDMASAVKEGRFLFERQYVRKNGTKFWGNGLLTSTKDKKGTHQGFSKIMRDATVQNDLHKTAVHNSNHDFLTGLPNRNFFEESLIVTIATLKKETRLAVLYLDFNNFKLTNDEQSHRVGDLVLIEIAHRLTRNIRISDVAARFGGDEFVILAKSLRSRTDVARFAQKIIKAFRVPIIIEKKVIRTSVSMGIALYPNDAKKPSELLRFSDLALYQAKKFGGNQYQFYDKTLTVKKGKY